VMLEVRWRILDGAEVKCGMQSLLCERSEHVVFSGM
jgi:hypothetical protein